MSLPRYQNVRKVDGLGITLADLLKQLNELRNKQPEVYYQIVETVKPIFVQVPEFIQIIKEVYIELPPKEIVKIMFPAGVIGTSSLYEVPTPMSRSILQVGSVSLNAV